MFCTNKNKSLSIFCFVLFCCLWQIEFVLISLPYLEVIKIKKSFLSFSCYHSTEIQFAKRRHVVDGFFTMCRINAHRRKLFVNAFNAFFRHKERDDADVLCVHRRTEKLWEKVMKWEKVKHSVVKWCTFSFVRSFIQFFSLIMI